MRECRAPCCSRGNNTSHRVNIPFHEPPTSSHRLLSRSARGFFTTLQAADAKPLKVLLVTGGGFHDYDKQHLILAAGINARANIEVILAHSIRTRRTKTQVKWDMYQNKDWAKGYDVVIHDECSADVTDPEYVGHIIAAHRDGMPAVNLHCAMHCYRWGNFKEPVAAGADNSHWYEMIGLQSTAHGPQEPIAIDFVDKASPIVKGMADWTTVKEELYNNIQILGAHALAKGTAEGRPTRSRARRRTWRPWWRGPMNSARKRRESSAPRSATTTRRWAMRATSTW